MGVRLTSRKKIFFKRPPKELECTAKRTTSEPKAAFLSTPSPLLIGEFVAFYPSSLPARLGHKRKRNKTTALNKLKPQV